MPPPYANGETVVIIRSGPPTQDDYGNDVPGALVETAVAGCAVWPRTTSEDVQARQQVLEGVSIVLPFGTDVLPTDRVRVRGVLYDVDGDPGEWQSALTGTKAGVQVDLTRVTG